MEVQAMYPAKMIWTKKIGRMSWPAMLLSAGMGFTHPLNVSQNIKNEPSQAIK